MESSISVREACSHPHASFRQTKTVNQNIRCVLICDKSYTYFVDNRETVTLEDLLAVFTEANPKTRPETFSGDHTREAVYRLKAKFPMGAPWQRVFAWFYVCKNNASTVRFLRFASNQNNQLNQIF